LNKIGKHEPILIYIIDRLKFYEKWELHSFKIPLYKALRRRNSGEAWQTPFQLIVAVNIISHGTASSKDALSSLIICLCELQEVSSF